MICYVRDYIPITNSLSYSNGYCELVCMNLPSINTVIITLYRPPGCLLDKFLDVMNVIKDWISKQESSKSPRIILNGDMNLPFMYDWSEDKINELLNYCTDRNVKGKSLSSDKRQAQELYDFVSRNVMEQFIMNQLMRSQETFLICFSVAILI